MNGGWLGGQEAIGFFSRISNLLLSRSSNFSRSLVFFENFVKFVKIQVVHDLCSGTGCKLVIGWWENCVLYSLFCIFIIVIIIIVSSSSSIYFVVVLNCPISIHRFSILSISPPHTVGQGGEEWVSSWGVLVASCQVNLRHCPNEIKEKEKKCPSLFLFLLPFHLLPLTERNSRTKSPRRNQSQQLYPEILLRKGKSHV